MSKINLGDKVKDSVTGFTGIAIGRTQWLHGCDRIIVQPAVDKTGKMGENAQFDEPQLILVKKAVVKVEQTTAKKTGGFGIMPMQNRV